ncbi:MAG: hypothetical protein GY757_30520, partial [bacterium]|nr:hypothetical protein [bacterium]
FTDLDEVIGGDGLSIPHLVQLYRDYLHTNKSWLFKDAPRRSDLNIFEAVFHFNFYSYLNEFLRGKGGRVLPEFPTGNGQIDLIVKYAQKTYGLELKSYSDQSGYRQALGKAAQYGSQLKLREIYLLFFVPFIDAPNRKKYEAGYLDKKTNVKVIPLFIETGS